MKNNICCIDSVKYPSTLFKMRRRVVKDIDECLMSLRKKSQTGLHLGAGNKKIPYMINCDLYNPEADLVVDAKKIDMYENSSVDLIEAHHMIEHLSYDDTDLSLSEWNRVLKERGVLILTYPDLTAISIRWIIYSIIYTIIPKPDKLDYIVKMLMGSQEHEGMYHKNAFDYRRMSRCLLKHGFEIEYTYYHYPNRSTPSRLIIARKN